MAESYKWAINHINEFRFSFRDEKISTINSLNRVSAADVVSPTTYPSFNNSAFDGFVVVAKETKKLSKKKTKKFKILRIIAAGDDPKINIYEKNSVAEIMTGGLIPKPFDSIIPVETVKYFPSKNNATHIVINQEIEKFAYVRFAGEDYKSKDIVVKKGELIESKHILALTSLGIKEILVKKKPKIIFYSTGKELVDYKKDKIPLWKVRNSNAHYFFSICKILNYEIIDGGIIKDNWESIEKATEKIVLTDIDIFVSSGGVSAGKFDLITKKLKDLSKSQPVSNNKIRILDKVRIKPGKPIACVSLKIGKQPLSPKTLPKYHEKIWFGLPGNPISSAACFRFFVYPLIRKGLGITNEKRFKAKLYGRYSKKPHFTHFLKCSVKFNNKGFYDLKILEGQQSNRIKSFVEANCWGIFPENKKKFKLGDIIEWVPLIPSG